MQLLPELTQSAEREANINGAMLPAIRRSHASLHIKRDLHSEPFIIEQVCCRCVYALSGNCWSADSVATASSQQSHRGHRLPSSVLASSHQETNSQAEIICSTIAVGQRLRRCTLNSVSRVPVQWVNLKSANM